jgi:hypothetical protein
LEVADATLEVAVDVALQLFGPAAVLACAVLVATPEALVVPVVVAPVVALVNVTVMPATCGVMVALSVVLAIAVAGVLPLDVFATRLSEPVACVMVNVALVPLQAA